MSYELIAYPVCAPVAILLTAGFQSVMLYRFGRELNANIRAYGAGNPRTTMRLEDELRRIDQYVREHGAEFEGFLADLSRHFAARQ
jgi:hypothetical protein